jgi:hypothetical protein
MVYKKGSLCSPGSAFGLESAELWPAFLINLLPERFGAPSVCLNPPTTFLGCSPGIRRVVFSSPCHGLSAPGLPGGPPLPGTTRPVVPGGGSFSPGERGNFWLHKGTRKAQEPTCSPAYQTGKNPGSNSGLPQEAEEESDQFPTRVTTFWG